MKKSLSAVLLLSCAAFVLALDFTMENGRVLKDARLLKVSKNQAYISHEDGVTALPLTPAVTETFQITVGDEPKPSLNLLKSEVENWLLDIKTNNTNYRPEKEIVVKTPSLPPMPVKKTVVKQGKPTDYQVEQFASQYVPAEDDGRRITLFGTVTQIIGRRDQFKIILNNTVVFIHFSSQIPSSLDISGNAKAIGPFAVGRDVSVSGKCSGTDSKGYILLTQ